VLGNLPAPRKWALPEQRQQRSTLSRKLLRCVYVCVCECGVSVCLSVSVGGWVCEYGWVWVSVVWCECGCVSVGGCGRGCGCGCGCMSVYLCVCVFKTRKWSCSTEVLKVCEYLEGDVGVRVICTYVCGWVVDIKPKSRQRRSTLS